MLIIDDIKQGSPEWALIRAGVFTASNFDRILTPKTRKPSAQQDAYLCQLAAESVLGSTIETQPNAHMARGIELEPEARRYFEFEKDCKVREVAFIYLDDRKSIGCSPDGLVGEDSGIEIKSPSAAVHTRYLLDGVVPSEYILQVQGCMMVTGFDTWHFLSYHPGLPPLLILSKRDEELISMLRTELEACLVRLGDYKGRLLALQV